MRFSWQNVQGLSPRTYTCGYCGLVVASASGYQSNHEPVLICICPQCAKPTYLDGGVQIPGVAPGSEVTNLPPDVEALYREARNCISVASYTAAVLACRKLLMNIAVAQGAKPGESFVSYVEHLANAGFIPPNGKGWVDHIRKKGNEATHEIALMTQSDATDLITFAEMLLKFIYEFPLRVPKP